MAWVSEPVLFLKVRIDETLVLSSKMTNNWSVCLLLTSVLYFVHILSLCAYTNMLNITKPIKHISVQNEQFKIISITDNSKCHHYVVPCYTSAQTKY
jgi:hypothetical protein